MSSCKICLAFVFVQKPNNLKSSVAGLNQIRYFLILVNIKTSESDFTISNQIVLVFTISDFYSDFAISGWGMGMAEREVGGGVGAEERERECLTGLVGTGSSENGRLKQLNGVYVFGVG